MNQLAHTRNGAFVVYSGMEGSTSSLPTLPEGGREFGAHSRKHWLHIPSGSLYLPLCQVPCCPAETAGVYLAPNPES